MKKFKLFCIPYAGASAQIYLKWNDCLHPSIELVPVELAGRGQRHKEPLYQRFEDAVNDAVHFLTQQTNGTGFAVYGHSLGSLIAFEAVKRLQKQGTVPAHVFFSGMSPPRYKSKSKFHLMSDDEFIDVIVQIGGTPEEIFSNPNLKKVFLPILRADYRIYELYQYNENDDEKLHCGMSILYSPEDELALDNKMPLWLEHTDQSGSLYPFEGGHFFINPHKEEVINLINKTLCRYIEETAHK